MAFDNVLSPQRQARRRMSAQLVIDIHRREEAVGIDRPVVDTGALGGVALASNTNSSCANIDVTGACCRIVSGTGTQRHVGGPVVIVERVKSDGRVGVSEGVVQQRIPAAGRIKAASGIILERTDATSCVLGADGVAAERGTADSRVVVRGVAKERVTADGGVARSFNVIKKGKGTVRRIVAPDGVAKERTNAGGRVA